MSNIASILQSQFYEVGTLLHDFQHLMTNEERVKTKQFLEISKPVYAILSKMINDSSNFDVRRELETYLENGTYYSLNATVSSLIDIFRKIQNNTSLLKTRYPREQVFPASWTQADWEEDWVKNLAKNQQATHTLLKGLNSLNQMLADLPARFLFVALLENASKGILITTVSRVLDKLSSLFKLPKIATNMLNILGYVGFFAKIAYDTQATLVSSAVHFISQFGMTKLGANPREARQVASIAAITSLSAIELYYHPAPNNVAKLITTLGGATLGVVATDLLLDTAEHCVTYGYEKYSQKQPPARLSANDLAKQEAIRLLGHNPDGKPAMQTRATTHKV